MESLYKYVPAKIPLRTNIIEWKLLIPKCQRSTIISTNHDPPTCAHFGFYKTLARIQDYYYWPKMRQDILKYVRYCKICQSQKLANTKTMGLMGSEKNSKISFSDYSR